MADRNRMNFARLPCAMALASAVVLTACADRRGDDVGLRHPIVVERHPVTLKLSATPTARRIDFGTAGKLDEFFDGYFADGGGRLRIVAPPGATSGRRSAMANAIRDRALRHGIDASEIELVSSNSKRVSGRAYQLRYLRHSIRPPRCGITWGTWLTEIWEGWSNKVHPNYGCASQSYLGRMAARPRDLVKAHPAGPRDTTRSNGIIQLYRQGEPTAAKEKPDEKAIRTLTIK